MRTSTVSLLLLVLVVSASAFDANLAMRRQRLRHFERHHERHGRRSAAMNRLLARHLGLGESNAVTFLKGFAYGFDIVMGNPEACIQDAKTLLYDFEDGAKKIGDGIRYLKVSEVAQGLMEYADGIEKLAAALKDCGVIKTTEDIMRIVTEIRSGDIKAFVKDEVMHILGHGRELVELFKSFYASFKAKDYYTLGEDAGEILAILIDKDGANRVEVTPADVYALVRGVAEGLGSSMGDPSVCTKDIDGIIADFNAAWDDLLLGIKRVNVRTISRALSEFANGIEKIADSMSACGLEGLEKAIREVVADIRAGKVLQVVAREAVHIFCHGSEIIDDFKSVAQNWKAGQYEESGKKVGEIIGFIVQIPPAKN
jgi:hypothetical protein